MSTVVFDSPNILNENLIPLTDAAGEFPVKVCRASLERWIRRGSRGVLLETVMIGNRRYTSKEAVVRFLHGQQHTAPDSAPVKPSMTPKELSEKSRRLGLPEPVAN